MQKNSNPEKTAGLIIRMLKEGRSVSHVCHKCFALRHNSPAGNKDALTPSRRDKWFDTPRSHCELFWGTWHLSWVVCWPSFTTLYVLSDAWSWSEIIKVLEMIQRTCGQDNVKIVQQYDDGCYDESVKGVRHTGICLLKYWVWTPTFHHRNVF